MGGKVSEVLEGRDEFALCGVESDVFDGMADGEHGFVVEEVGDIGGGEEDGFGELGGTALCGGGHRLMLFYFKIRLEAAFKSLARVLLM